MCRFFVSLSPSVLHTLVRVSVHIPTGIAAQSDHPRGASACMLWAWLERIESSKEQPCCPIQNGPARDARSRAPLTGQREDSRWCMSSTYKARRVPSWADANDQPLSSQRRFLTPSLHECSHQSQTDWDPKSQRLPGDKPFAEPQDDTFGF